MASEKEWVRLLQPRLAEALIGCRDGEWVVRVETGKRLTYAFEILQYNGDETHRTHISGYETDLLIYDIRENGDWVPRVVVECKSGGVTTHDALTYSTKAATHKQVHPYLRYGVLVGDFDTALPGRLIRHGAFFDFMMVWPSQEPKPLEWNDLLEVLKEEIGASRQLQSVLTESRQRGRKRFQLLHRPLKLLPDQVSTSAAASSQDESPAIRATRNVG